MGSCSEEEDSSDDKILAVGGSETEGRERNGLMGKIAHAGILEEEAAQRCKAKKKEN